MHPDPTILSAADLNIQNTSTGTLYIEVRVRVNSGNSL
jgi:hypothetical protein